MLHNVVSTLFRVCTVIFLLGGVAIVAGQSVGLVVGDGELVTSVADLLAPYVYGSAGIAGLAAFMMSYRRGEKERADDHHDSDHPTDARDTSVATSGGERNRDSVA